MDKYKLADTPSGSKTLLYIDPATSREVRLHSGYDPVKESERAAESFKPGRSSIIIVSGLGLAYHINALRKKFSFHSIIVIEKDSEVMDLLNKHYPENITNIQLITASKDIPLIFDGTDITMIRGISSYIHRPSYNLYKDFYDEILKDIKEYISSRVSDLLTRFEFEENWIEHIFRNVHHVFSSTPVSDLFGKFRDLPGIIVSAGPSLKKNVKLLNDIKDRALIVCVDTALKVLLKHNIVPHLVMTLDSQKYSLKHFLGLKDKNLILLADIVSQPRLIESFEGEKVISATAKYFSDEKGNVKRETTPVWDWIEKYTGPIGDIQSGGSVATSVFDLFLNLGCDPIILMGQDLAYTGREIHCTGTYHNDEWLPKTSRFLNLETINQKVIRKRKIKYVEAYKGNGKVISDFVFDIYKNWFSDSAGKVNNSVINATEGGARIMNTEEISLKEISLDLNKRTTAKNPEEILQRSLIKNSGSAPGSPEILLKGVCSVIDELKELKLKSDIIANDQTPDGTLLKLINGSIVSEVITPFLRKTFIYLSRHPDLSEKKAGQLLIADFKLSSDKLIRMLEVCRKNLEKIR